jgi:hypothetical protein
MKKARTDNATVVLPDVLFIIAYHLENKPSIIIIIIMGDMTSSMASDKTSNISSPI